MGRRRWWQPPLRRQWRGVCGWGWGGQAHFALAQGAVGLDRYTALLEEGDGVLAVQEGVHLDLVDAGWHHLAHRLRPQYFLTRTGET
jgi:hypothetical protein